MIKIWTGPHGREFSGTAIVEYASTAHAARGWSAIREGRVQVDGQVLTAVFARDRHEMDRDRGQSDRGGETWMVMGQGMGKEEVGAGAATAERWHGTQAVKVIS